MIINDIRKANMIALKNKDASARIIYSILINKYQLLEIEAKANNKIVSDDDVLKIIAKALKELSEEKSGYEKVGNTIQVESIKHQEEILKAYLPKMLSEEEIKEIISNIEEKTMPNIMKYFKINYDGKVDMSLVSSLARTML